LDLAVQVGEDAYFIRENAMGVADGVGGWARSRKHSSDPYTPSARISRGLMHFCSSAFSSSSYPQYLSPPPPHPPDFALPTAESADPESTISEEDGLRVQVAHLGDCALYQFRPGVGLVFRSEEMVHSFNHPVQLGPHSKTTPLNDARPYSIPVRRHDVLVLASDGVSDNLWD
ncbi:hypothetical protein SISNIDRAFT_401072, partial [Sistotremastrum niveocremeum HHB9708]